MSDQTRTNPTRLPNAQLEIDERVYSGVLSSRLIAYLIDLVMIAILSVILFFIIGVLGVLTLGLAWVLMPLLAGTGVIYSAITVGGSRSATIGMRVMGLRVVTEGGRPPGVLAAAVHALLFYVAASTALLLLIDIVIGLARRDRRLGHDLVVDFTIINTR